MEAKTERIKCFFKTWWVRIFVLFLLTVFVVLAVVAASRIATPVQRDPNLTVAKVIWDSIISGFSGITIIFLAVIDIIAMVFEKTISKPKTAIMSAVIYIVVIFDKIALECKLHAAWIAVVNVVALVICAIMLVLQKQTADTKRSKRSNDWNALLSRAASETKNKKIIAVQLYKVNTSLIVPATAQEQDKVRFEIRHIGEDFVRPGNDVNCISYMTYDLDRQLVDCFPIILNFYDSFRNTGDDSIIRGVRVLIEDRIKNLEEKLSDIEKSKRDVSKEDCCNARALTILLAFRQRLNEDHASMARDDCLGEISLCDGAFKIDAETERQLFSLYRTGILGAALLDSNTRHIFEYRKNSSKAGRRYCVSQLMCDTTSDVNGFTCQTMYIGIFTIKESDRLYFPGYCYPSIEEREKAITTVLKK